MKFIKLDNYEIYINLNQHETRQIKVKLYIITILCQYYIKNWIKFKLKP